MSTLVWIATWVVIAIWSGVSWIAHGLVSVGGDLIANNADIIPAADPLLVEWASWLAHAGTGVGEWLVIVLWAIVSLVIFGAGAYRDAPLAKAQTFASKQLKGKSCLSTILNGLTDGQVIARRNMRLGIWAGMRLGLRDDRLSRYARDVMDADYAQARPR